MCWLQYYLNALIVQSRMSGSGRHLRGTKVFVVSLFLPRFEEAHCHAVTAPHAGEKNSAAVSSSHASLKGAVYTSFRVRHVSAPCTSRHLPILLFSDVCLA